MNGALSELDLIVESLDATSQRVAVRFKNADEARSVTRQSPWSQINIDFVSLQADYLDRKMERYGNRLRDAVLVSNRARTLFGEAMSAKPLRVRLNVRADDAILQSLHWETMTDFNDAPLSSLRDLAFSRYLPSDKDVTLRPAGDALRALVAVANPSPEDRQKYDLAPIEFQQEQLDKSMGKIVYDQLSGKPVSMNRLINRLQEGEATHDGYDILYLVAHGAIVRGEPQLVLALETEAEQRERKEFRSGQKLAERMARQLSAMPRLVVLASCSGAGYGMDDALYATGPRLAMEGVPAVMAMKGFVNINMVEALLAKFFTEFQETPEVDRAMQAARAHVQWNMGADDWWAPVLFMRLNDGRLASGDGGWQAQNQPEPSVPNGSASSGASEPAPRPVDMSRFDRSALYKAMDEAFELADLEDLTFEMGIPFEDLGSRRKSGKVRELIQWCQRRKMIPTLLHTLTELRDEIDWYEAAGLG